MEEQELIDLINSITYGELSLNDFNKNELKKEKITKEIRDLYSKIKDLENEIEEINLENA